MNVTSPNLPDLRLHAVVLRGQGVYSPVVGGGLDRQSGLELDDARGRVIRLILHSFPGSFGVPHRASGQLAHHKMARSGSRFGLKASGFMDTRQGACPSQAAMM